MGKRGRSPDSEDDNRRKRHRSHRDSSRRSRSRSHSHSHRHRSRSHSHSHNRRSSKLNTPRSDASAPVTPRNDSVNLVLESKSGKKTYLPAPLVLDDEGNEVDVNGNIIKNKTFKSVATLKINQKSVTKITNPYTQPIKEKEIAPAVIDKRIHIKSRASRKDRALKFREEGSFVKKAESIRAREERIRIAELQKQVEMEHDAALANNNDAVDIIRSNDEDIPNMEWWDGDFLPDGKRDDFKHANTFDKDSYEYSQLSAENCQTLGLIHRPSQVQAALPETKPKPIPLLYTKKERKKLRRKERMEKHKEEQDMIRIGMIEAPEPKLTRSNMMQLYKDEAVANPTIIEQKMQEQVAKRLANHQKRNEDRKLTPQQRKVKKLKKLIGDRTEQQYIAVFKVEDLSNNRIRFKVDVNAQQNYLTGQIMLCPSIRCNMVLVEGTKKSIDRYTKLMIRRIKWNVREEEEIEEIGKKEEDNNSNNKMEEEDDDDNEKMEDDKEKEGENGDKKEDKEEKKEKKEKGEVLENHCYLVWRGIAGKQVIKDFAIDTCSSYASGREKLEMKGLAQYWDMVKNYTEDTIN